jgi:polyphosphate glucokinase
VKGPREVQALGIDIGGSGVKGAIVDVTSGKLASDRHRIPTPQPSTPDAVIDVVSDIVRFHEWSGPVGVTVPSVVMDGVVMTAANIDDGWIDFDAAAALSEALGRDVVVLNDADAAGMAEVRHGAARDTSGVCIVLTFGTGIGSAIINDGVLVPNSELGHLHFRGMEAEEYAAGRLVKRENMDIDWWSERVNELLQHIDLILSPRTIVFGGGISKRFAIIAPHLRTRATVVPAQLRNNAGIVGAAMAATGREYTR